MAPAVAVQQPLIHLTPQQRQASGLTLEAAQAAGDKSALTGSRAQVLPGRVVVPNDRRDLLIAGVTGRLESALVNPGDHVKAGQPLLRLYSGELLGLQRAYLAAAGTAALATKRLARDETLFADGIIAESRLQDSRDQALQAAAGLQEQRQLLSLAGLGKSAIDSLRSANDLSARVTLTAPRAGVVLEQPVEVGAQVESGAALLHLAAVDRQWVELQATREQLAAVTIGDAVEVVGCTAQGKVIAAGGQLDAGTQTALVRAQFTAAGACLAPGQFVQLSIVPAAAPAGSVTVASESVVQRAGKDYVFIEEGGGLRPVPVKVLRRQGEVTVLGGGISAGTRVASKGLAALKGSWMGLGTAAAGNE
jgi:hypothetical protein